MNEPYIYARYKRTIMDVCLYEVPRSMKFIEGRSRRVVARGCERGSVVSQGLICTQFWV
jgi:hypothetical protein